MLSAAKAAQLRSQISSPYPGERLFCLAITGIDPKHDLPEDRQADFLGRVDKLLGNALESDILRRRFKPYSPTIDSARHIASSWTSLSPERVYALERRALEKLREIPAQNQIRELFELPQIKLGPDSLLEELELSRRVVNALLKEGFGTVQELIDAYYDSYRFYRVPGFKQQGYRQVVLALDQLGLIKRDPTRELYKVD